MNEFIIHSKVGWVTMHHQSKGSQSNFQALSLVVLLTAILDKSLHVIGLYTVRKSRSVSHVGMHTSSEYCNRYSLQAEQLLVTVYSHGICFA